MKGKLGKGLVGEGGQSGCEPRIKVIVKMQKNVGVGGGPEGVAGGLGVGCEPKIKVIVKMQIKRSRGS